MKKLIISLLMITSQISFSYSQWVQSNGPYISSYISNIVTDGTNIYAGTDNGMFKSTNNGASWVTINNGLASYTVSALAMNGSNILAATQNQSVSHGIYMSTNGGASWSPTGLPNMYVSEIIVNGTDIFAATLVGGIFHSTDNGAVWTQVNNGLTEMYIMSLTFHGSDLFAGSYTSGIFHSTDNGALWTSVGAGIPAANHSIFSLGSNGSVIFAGTVASGGATGVYVSSDNGGLWTEANTGLTNLYIYAFASTATETYAGTLGGIFYTHDNGAHWTEWNDGLTSPTISSLCLQGTQLLAGTSGPVGEIFLRSTTAIGLEENHLQSTCLAYPNPSNGNFKVEGKYDRLEIRNMLGEIIYSSTFTGSDFSGVNISDHPAGVYHLIVYNHNQSSSLKIVIQ